MTIGVILPGTVDDKVCLGDVPPAQTMLFSDGSALAIVALRSMSAGREDGMPQFLGTLCIVLLCRNGIRQHDVGNIIMLVIVLIDHFFLPLFMIVSPTGQWLLTEQIHRQK